jgi:hypothetical protein
VADPNRDFDAIVIGSHERAFRGHQFSLAAPVPNHYGVQLWVPELGGMVEPGISTVEDLVDLLGILSRREIALKRTRTLAAMQYAAVELDRFMGGRPAFGYLLIDLGPHPNRRPDYAPVVRWMFQARLERYTYRRIQRRRTRPEENQATRVAASGTAASASSWDWSREPGPPPCRETCPVHNSRSIPVSTSTPSTGPGI